jgi:uncharacterized protein (DUF1778 family)
MFGSRIRISKELHNLLTKTAVERGYSSTDEFVVHVLEKACAGAEEAVSDEEVEERLKGMGYIE